MKKILRAIITMSLFTIFLTSNVNADEIFTQKFDSSIGSWTQTVGTTKFEIGNNQLSISNTTQGSNIESIALLNNSPVYQDGEVEMDFLYEGQKNFSSVFRGDASDKAKWQTVAYNTEGRWTVGQPGGKWLTNISGPTLLSGKTYRLLISYEGKKIEAFIDDELFYENDNVTYSDGTTINDEWDGKIGVRLFGDRSTLKINSLKSGPIGSIRISSDDIEQFSMMRKKWKANLVGDFDSQPSLLNDDQVKSYVTQLSDSSNELYHSIDRSDKRTNLWEPVSSDTASANLTTQFKKLNTLAKAYGTKGTDLYNNEEMLEEIELGLNVLTADGRYSGLKYFGNWWDWQIGVPQEFVPILIVLYDDLSKEKVTEYVEIMSKYLPNPYQQMYGKAQFPAVDLSFIPDFKNSGANRTDHALSFLGLGILSNNASKTSEAVTSIEEIFKTVTSGDGFYADGSFIQHTYIPYTGSYGNVLIKGVGKIYSVVSETKWAPIEENKTDFVNKVTNSFIPITVNGETMSFVNGRSISRAPSATKTGFGSTTLYNLLITAEFADSTNKELLRQTAKYWMVQNSEYYLDNTRDFKDLLLTKEVLSDETIDINEKPFIGSRVYGSMDRYVYSDSNVNLGISMYSTRTYAFEALNKENKKGWHTSDGMVYLYNKDGQFGSSYWPTVDWYRLPGTTVDTRPLSDETALKEFKSVEDYVGGVSDENDAVVSMQLNKAGTYNNTSLIDMDLKAKKSWFVFDGKIISLGSDINGISDSSIETIIDNRMLDSSSSYQLINQDGDEVSNVEEKTLSSSDWLLLNSSGKNQNIGYLILDDQKITTKREERTGTYKAINDAFPSDIEYKENYQKIIVQHGNNISDGKYAYITYPNADETKLNELKNSKRFTVLENDKEIQAVSDKKENKIGITFWNEDGGSIKGITTDKSSSVIYKEGDNYFQISLSNPKQTNKEIQVTLPRSIKEVISIDDSVEIIDSSTIKINTSNGLGKTYSFKASFEEEEKIEVESVNITNSALSVVKVGKTIDLGADVLPENATDKSIIWSVSKPEIASIESNKFTAKKAGITKVTATSSNGKNDTFIVRVTQ